MARWIVLSNARIAGDGVAVRLYTAGDVLDDAHVDVASLRANGLAVAPYSDAMARALRAFRAAQRANPRLDMIGAILGDDAAAAALRGPDGSEPVTIWVDAAAGDDAANGGRDTPLRTLRAAVARVPVPNFRDYRIRLAPGTYTADVLTERGFLCVGGSVEILPAQMPTVLADVVTTGVPSDPGVVVAGAGWTTDEHVGKTARILVDTWADGAPRYVYKTIVRNTADTLLFAASTYDDGLFANVTPGVGSTVQILEPSINLEMTGRAVGNGVIVGDQAAHRWGHGSVTFPAFVDTLRVYLCRWTASAPLGAAACVDGECVMYGCEIDQAGAFGSPCEIAVRAAGAWDAFGPARRFGSLEVIPGEGVVERTGQLCGAGVFIDGEFGPRDFRGFVVAQLIEGYGGLIHIMGGRVTGNDAGAPWSPGVYPVRPSVFRAGMLSAPPSCSRGYLYLIPTTGREFNDAALSLFAPSSLELYRAGALIVDTAGVAGVDGVRAQGAMMASLAGGLDVRITVEAASSGIHVRQGARMTVRPASTTITGPAAGYRAGNTTGATVTSGAPLVSSSPADGSALVIN